MGEIKEHDDQPLTGRTMIGPEQNAREQFAADQPPGLDHHADDHGACEAHHDNSRQSDRQPASGEPVEMIGLRSKAKPATSG